MSRRRYDSRESEAVVLEHALTAPHPFLAVIHFYGEVRWCQRRNYYEILRAKLRRHRMRMAHEWAITIRYEKKFQRCTLPKAAIVYWLVQPSRERPLCPRDYFQEAQRQALHPPCPGTCSILEAQREKHGLY